MEIAEVISLVLLGAVIQFFAAIIGPRALHVVSVLLILAAAGAAAYLLYFGIQAKFAGVAADARNMAINFGLLAAGFLAVHLFMRWLFKAMYRASHA